MGSPLVRFDSDGSLIDQGTWKAGQIADRSLLPGSTIAAPSNVIAADSDATITGTLSGVEDYDLIGVSLVAGQTYSFSYRGTVEGGISDPYLALFNPALNTVLYEDDDGGLGRSSLITYTATQTGTYYLYATTYDTIDSGDSSIDTGGYTIDIWSPDPATDAPSTFEGAELVTPGTVFGYLDSATDVDTYEIVAEAGQLFSFTYNGGIAYAAEFADPLPGENIGVIEIYDAEGNLIDGAVNYETGISFFAEEGGTYYVQVSPYDPTLLGGYTLDVATITPGDYDPLDSIDWVNAANVPFVDVNGVPTAYVYFAPAGENFGETGDDGVSPMETFGWQQFQIDGVMSALGEFEEILGVNYVITTDASQATFRLLTTESEQYGAFFYPRDPSYGTQQGIGAFNLLSGGFTVPASLLPGGYSYAVVLHEFGHAHGLAHPHDNGGGSDVMLGVTGSDSLGIYDLNQGVYTVMSYNDGWATNPSGPQPFTRATIGYGWSGSLSAFDIAQLQSRYGVHAQNATNTTYRLDDANVTGTFFETIWDTGGTDTIRYIGNRDVHIDLLAATLDYSPTGGGVVSYVDGIYGGYTIANGVVIENATGGGGDDSLIGNDANNTLIGNGGDDILMGRAGNDNLYGYAGDDQLEGGAGNDILRGGLGNDILDGGEGDDKLLGEDGDNVMIGGDGRDYIYGGGGEDTVDAGAGIDTLRGGDDNDSLSGGEGDDVIYGDAGADIIIGNAGRDIMWGGTGADTFVFTEVSDSTPAFRDVIRDFSQAQGDLIDLSVIDSGATDGAFTLVSAFSGVAGELVSSTQGGFQQVRGDVNGDGIADFAILVSVAGGGALTAADFVL